MKKLLGLIALAFIAPVFAQTPATISSLPPASALAGAEAFPVDQGLCPTCTKQTSTASIAAYTVGKGLFPVDNYSTSHNGTTDDTAAFNSALSACTAAGGGAVVLGPYQYALTSANLTVPSYCEIRGKFWQGSRNTTEDFTTTPYTLVLNPSYTINLAWNAGLENVIVRRSGMTVLTTTRQMVQAVAAFSGTAVTLAGHDTFVNNVLIVGFTTGIYGTGFARHVLNNVFIDATNGINIDNSHDTTRLSNIELWPFVVGNLSGRTVDYAVTGAADNGSGLYRLTVPANIFITGDTVYVANVGGAAGANGTFLVTVVDSTHIDLQASAVAPATTATWASGSTYLTLASAANIAAGQTITGTNIPGATTVSEVHLASSVIKISAATTGAGSGTAVTFSNPAYTSLGDAFLTTPVRSGAALTVTNSETVLVTNFFEYGWDTCVHIGTAAGWVFLANFGCDGNAALDRLENTAVVVDGSSYSANLVNGQISTSYGTGIQVNSTGATGHNLANIAVSAAPGNAILDAIAGRVDAVNLSSSSTQANKVIWVADTIGSLQISNSDLPTIAPSYQSATGQRAARISLASNILRLGQVSIGSGFGTGVTLPRKRASVFSINVGTSSGSSGVINLPAIWAADGWACTANDVTTPATNMTQQTGSTATTVTLTNYVRTTGIAGNWPDNDIIEVACSSIS